VLPFSPSFGQAQAASIAQKGIAPPIKRRYAYRH